MKKQTAVLIEGDGIGPEVSKAVVHVLEAAGASLDWVRRNAGLAAIESGNNVMPDETIDSILQHGVALKGPCTTPVGKGFSSVNVQLRKKLNLYAAVRPVRSMPGIETRFKDVDLVIIRENTEGLYSGIENEVTPGVVTSLKVATDKACERIARWAFNYAVERDRKSLAVMHKANIMKLTDGLFIRKSREVHDKEFPSIDYREVIIDAGCMRLVQDPTKFDMLLLENLYGDVVSDLCAGLVGGLGVVPGANIGDEHAVFEAVHGSAPDIAGKNAANPLALLMSGVMMLNYMADKMGNDGARDVAVRIKTAYDQTLLEGAKTRDLGGKLGTAEFAEEIIKRL